MLGQIVCSLTISELETALETPREATKSLKGMPWMSKPSTSLSSTYLKNLCPRRRLASVQDSDNTCRTGVDSNSKHAIETQFLCSSWHTAYD